MKVIQNEQELVPADILAQSIKNIGEAVGRLDRSGLSEKAIVLLLSNASGETRTTVSNVLWALRNLERLYLKPKAKK